MTGMLRKFKGVFFLAFLGACRQGGENMPVTTPKLADKADTETRAAMRVHVDPVTGRFGRPPASVTAAPQAAHNTSSAGLVEVPGRHGGMVVNLQGRFASAMQATLGSDGGLTTSCDQRESGTER
jgi:hypothetical protein